MAPSNAQADEYDYIVCGGGTSGCVVAARLAESSDVKVLLIEAGSDGKDNENIKMVGGWSKNFDTDADWNLKSTPRDGVNGRQVALSRGKFLGGSSGVNGTLCIRGTNQDYDDWNLPGWSGEEMFAYMRKSEDFHTKDWFEADEKAHGYGGPLKIEPHDLAPISSLLLDSMESKGLTLNHDMFTNGSSAHGCGHVPRTHHKGIRSTGADFVTDDYLRSNIDIVCDTLVDKINFDSSMRAVSVDLVGTKAKDDKKTIKTRHEIIVSGGAYCSPAVLLRSGLGDKHELAQYGIECKVDLPGVGKNLLDHLIVFTFYEVEKEGLTNDHLVFHGDAATTSYMLYKQKKTGVLSTFPFGSFGFARLDERLKDEPLWQEAQAKQSRAGRDPMDLTASQPHIEYFNTELYGGPKMYDSFPIDKKHAFAFITELFSPRSKGTVTLDPSKPTDAHANPIVDNNYLADPLDMLVLSEGVRFGNEIVMQGAGTKDVVKGSWPANLQHHAFETRAEWEEHVRNNATTCYHAAGTCKMGPDDDREAVLDARLHVRGVKGLRVADCSVMPLLNGGHTQMPAFGIGERCADMIKEDRPTLFGDVAANGTVQGHSRTDSGVGVK